MGWGFCLAVNVGDEISIMFYIEREAWLVLVLFPLASCWHGIPNRSFLCGPKLMTGTLTTHDLHLPLHTYANLDRMLPHLL